MRSTTHSPDTTLTLQSIDRPSPAYRTSLFNEHQLQARTFRNSEHQHYPSDWIIISFLACLIIFAWSHFFYYKRLRQIYRAPLSQRFLNILTKEGSLFKERISLALSLVYIFTFSFFLVLMLKELLPDFVSRFPEYQVFLFCAAGMLVFWSVKITAIRFLGIVFRTMPATRDYLQNVLSFTFITGIIILPLLILILFLQSSILLYITLVVIGLMNFFRLLRGFFIGISLKKFSWLFLFVYLCSLEILPLLVILKGLYIFSKGF
ncbi:MAG: DUF4271 domain-containing protein [Bacteroidetes bacterium]|nr:DUF4271 domain-containing protein [Bacteroidota bacterium]